MKLELTCGFKFLLNTCADFINDTFIFVREQRHFSVSSNKNVLADKFCYLTNFSFVLFYLIFSTRWKYVSNNTPVTDSNFLARFEVDGTEETNNCAALTCNPVLDDFDFYYCDWQFVDADCSELYGCICEAFTLHDQAQQSGGD